MLVTYFMWIWTCVTTFSVILNTNCVMLTVTKHENTKHMNRTSTYTKTLWILSIRVFYCYTIKSQNGSLFRVVGPRAFCRADRTDAVDNTGRPEFYANQLACMYSMLLHLRNDRFSRKVYLKTHARIMRLNGAQCHVTICPFWRAPCIISYISHALGAA